jgi:hypothetical protein
LTNLFVVAIALFWQLGEGKHATVDVDGERSVTASLVYHGGALEPVGDFGVLNAEALANRERFVELGFLDETYDAVGEDIKRVVADDLPCSRRRYCRYLRTVML